MIVGIPLMKKYFITLLAFICSLLTSFAETEDPPVSETEDSPVKDSHTLLTEGYLQLQSGQKDEALATFDQILKQDADNQDAHFGQALAFAQQKRHADAFAAYDWITRQNPHHIEAWNGRGLAAFNMEDFDEALASFEMSVADQPVNGFLYESIAWTQMCRGEFKEAADWAKTALLMYNRKGEVSMYPLLIAYFSYNESGDAENALRVLKYANKEKSSIHWPTPVIDYLSNRINEAELISSVSSLSEETEAHTYIGLNMRLLDNPEKAERHLSWVSREGDSEVFEYTVAKTLTLKQGVVLTDR